MMSFQHHLMNGPEEQIPAMNRVKQIIKAYNILTICGDITVGIHHTPEGRDYESGGKRLNPLMHGRFYRPNTKETTQNKKSDIFGYGLPLDLVSKGQKKS